MEIITKNIYCVDGLLIAAFIKSVLYVSIFFTVITLIILLSIFIKEPFTHQHKKKDL